MSLAERITARAAHPHDPRSLSARARRRRWERFSLAFPDIAELRVLDLGGTPWYWESAVQRPRAVTVVNLERLTTDDPRITAVQGDACAPPAEALRGSYDLVVSNSLLEHVGGHAQRRRLSEVVHQVADRHWVQTPYRYFPVEPHWLCPGIQFLPFAARVQVTRYWPLGHMQAEDTAAAVARTHEVELIGLAEMRAYFPGSHVWLERLAGLPKSMVALRG